MYKWFPSGEPELFPLSDTSAIYMVEKDTEEFYSIKYSGKQNVIADHAYVISTPVELSSFEGKPVDISGEFISGNKQCIQDKCVTLSSNWLGVKINSIILK